MKVYSLVAQASPAIGTLRWVPDWRVRLKYEGPDGRTPGALGHPYFVDRHVDPRPCFSWTALADRDAPGVDEVPAGCHVSAAARPPRSAVAYNGEGLTQHRADTAPTGGELFSEKDGRTAHQRDWDFLCEKGSEILAAAGCQDSASTASHDRAQAVVQVFAEYAASRSGPVYPSRHGVDVALHSSYCDGRANLLAALCMVHGISARTIQNAVHTMVEVLVGGRWTFVDNVSTETLAKWETLEPGSCPRNVFHGMSFLDVVTSDWQSGRMGDPRTKPIPQAQAVAYNQYQPLHEPFINLHTGRWHFNQAGLGLERITSPLGSGSGVCAFPSPETFRALYADAEPAVLFASPGDSSILELNPPQGWFRSSSWIDRGAGIRRTFFIGNQQDLDGVVSATAELQLVAGAATDFDPARGGWEISVNGTTLSWEDLDLQADRESIRTRIPLRLLRTESMNEISLVSRSAYSEKRFYRMPDAMVFRVVPDLFELEDSWYLAPDLVESVPMGPVENTHSAWYLYPESQ